MARGLRQQEEKGRKGKEDRKKKDKCTDRTYFEVNLTTGFGSEDWVGFGGNLEGEYSRCLAVWLAGEPDPFGGTNALTHDCKGDGVWKDLCGGQDCTYPCSYKPTTHCFNARQHLTRATKIHVFGSTTTERL